MKLFIIFILIFLYLAAGSFLGGFMVDKIEDGDEAILIILLWPFIALGLAGKFLSDQIRKK